MIFSYRIALLSLLLTLPGVSAAQFSGVPEFIDEMVAKHHFKRAELEQVFARARYRQPIIDAISVPNMARPWPEYRASFVNARRISAGKKFWQQHRLALRRAERRYGVPAEIIAAVIGVETIYGGNTGNFRTLDALTTLAFEYPRRASFFRGELEQYLLLAREQDFNLLAVQGSYAGALGIPQFMPGSYRKYAVDFNGDGKIDLLRTPEDAIGSVAHYLKEYGWKKGEPIAVRARVSDEQCPGEIESARSLSEWREIGVEPVAHQTLHGDKSALLLDFTVPDGKEFWLGFDNFYAITRYNNSYYYAMSVYQLAEALRVTKVPR
ncbi:MAG: lytic murein transglycosylase B [Nitrosomonadales bacterium]|nr:lytic murein transglycosylase B [Nitrosomonadales bacterium]